MGQLNKQPKKTQKTPTKQADKTEKDHRGSLERRFKREPSKIGVHDDETKRRDYFVVGAVV